MQTDTETPRYSITTVGVRADGLAFTYPAVQVSDEDGLWERARNIRDHVKHVHRLTPYQVIRNPSGITVATYGTPPLAWRG